jgi:murein L,D-transpeptidase YcbB/YkuD
MGWVMKSLIFSLTFLLGVALPEVVQAQISDAAESEYINLMEEFSLQDIRQNTGQISLHGLQPNVYWTPEMEQSYLKDPGANNVWLRRRANESFYHLLRDVSIGGVDPQSLGIDIKVPQKQFMPVKDLGMLIVTTSARADLIVDALTPKNIWYDSLKQSLAYMMPLCQSGQWGALTNLRREIKLALKAKEVPELKARLRQYGYRIPSIDDVMDRDMMNAVVDVQSNLRMKPDGKISPGGKTWRYLNTPCAQRVSQLQADMEKIRWLPPTFEDRYILVNLAFSQFLLRDVKNGQPTIMNFKTINGRVERKTPMMKDRMDYIIFNPFWVVPPTIFIQDKVEEIRRLNYWQINAYFNAHQYEIWNRAFTQRIDPASIDWWSINEYSPVDFYIRQRPHLGNALGVVKFMLTNSFSIYLHDTNQRELFTEPNRLLSSGCVRLEKPVELAEYLLQGTEWDRRAIDAVLAKPGQVMTKDTKVPLTEHLPVYLINMTSQLNSDRVLRFTEDAYGQNSRIGTYLRPLL